MGSVFRYLEKEKKTGLVFDYYLGLRDMPDCVNDPKTLDLEKYLGYAKSGHLVSNPDCKNQISNFKETFSSFVSDYQNLITYEFDRETKLLIYQIYEKLSSASKVIETLKNAGLVNFELVEFEDKYFIAFILSEKYLEDLQAFFDSDAFSTVVHTFSSEDHEQTLTENPDGTMLDIDLIYPICDGCAFLVDLCVFAEQFGLEFEIC